jgi:hypothetical protein
LTNKLSYFIITLSYHKACCRHHYCHPSWQSFSNSKYPAQVYCFVEKSVESSKEFLSTGLVFKTGFVGGRQLSFKFEFKKNCFNPTLPWAIASYTCPVVFVCLNVLLLVEEKSRTNKKDTKQHQDFTRPVFHKVLSSSLVFSIEVIFPNLTVSFNKVCFLGT